MPDKTTPVLIRAELLPGLDDDGNARVLIGYAEGTCAQHSRIRYVDPTAIVRGTPSDWRSIDSAPHDGSIVEIMNNYGVEPSYSLCRWTREDRCWSVNGGGYIPIETREPSWKHVNGPGGPFAEWFLMWRPYVGDAGAYVDPTDEEQGGRSALTSFGRWLQKLRFRV